MYVLEVVDNKSRPSDSCSAQTGVAGSGAARHTLPSHGALREPPHPESINYVTTTNLANVQNQIQLKSELYPIALFSLQKIGH